MENQALLERYHIESDEAQLAFDCLLRAAHNFGEADNEQAYEVERRTVLLGVITVALLTTERRVIVARTANALYNDVLRDNRPKAYPSLERDVAVPQTTWRRRQRTLFASIVDICPGRDELTDVELFRALVDHDERFSYDLTIPVS